jgi:hypothetical protein
MEKHKCNTLNVEGLLRTAIKYWIIELIDCGGTTIRDTNAVILEEEPQLCEAYGPDRVLDLCWELHHAHDPLESARVERMSGQFNRLYFDGRLPRHSVQVVYDLDLLIDEPAGRRSLSFIDLELKRILIRRSFLPRPTVEATLLHQMAHLATNTPEVPNQDLVHEPTGRWGVGMARLYSVGAPIEVRDLNEEQFWSASASKWKVC